MDGSTIAVPWSVSFNDMLMQACLKTGGRFRYRHHAPLGTPAKRHKHVRQNDVVARYRPKAMVKAVLLREPAPQYHLRPDEAGQYRWVDEAVLL